MSKKRKSIDCLECDASFVVVYETREDGFNDEPSSCVFCGADLENEHDRINEEDDDLE